MILVGDAAKQGVEARDADKQPTVHRTGTEGCVCGMGGGVPAAGAHSRLWLARHTGRATPCSTRRVAKTCSLILRVHFIL